MGADIEGSNGIDKEPRTVKVVHLYPFPQNVMIM